MVFALASVPAKFVDVSSRKCFSPKDERDSRSFQREIDRFSTFGEIADRSEREKGIFFGKKI